jgi:mRNA-degrading endonuclease RelE of RelBE toxin-antitoxin system
MFGGGGWDMPCIGGVFWYYIHSRHTPDAEGAYSGLWRRKSRVIMGVCQRFLYLKEIKIFDVKQLKMAKETSRIYYRLRKGKYRAIFYVENNDILVIALDKREDIYRKWQ